MLHRGGGSAVKNGLLLDAAEAFGRGLVQLAGTPVGLGGLLQGRQPRSRSLHGRHRRRFGPRNRDADRAWRRYRRGRGLPNDRSGSGRRPGSGRLRGRRQTRRCLGCGTRGRRRRRDFTHLAFEQPPQFLFPTAGGRPWRRWRRRRLTGLRRAWPRPRREVLGRLGLFFGDLATLLEPAREARDHDENDDDPD